MSLTPQQTADLHDAIAVHLDRIGKLFKDPKITLVVRAPFLEDGDVVLTNDDLGDAIIAIRRMHERIQANAPDRADTKPFDDVMKWAEEMGGEIPWSPER